MSWYSDPWTQDDSVLGGLPYTVEPPAPYSIEGVKTVWHWSPSVLGGLPYTVAPPEPYSIEGIKTVWNWSPHVLGGLPYTVWMPPESAGIYIELPSCEMNVSAFAKIIIDKKTITFSVSGRIGTTFEKK